MSSLPRATASDLLPAARALGPSLAERAERAEAERTLPEDVVAEGMKVAEGGRMGMRVFHGR